MNKDQKYIAKYWIGHSVNSDDVFFYTAAKSKKDACKEMELTWGEDWFIDDNFSVDLFEIKLVELP